MECSAGIIVALLVHVGLVSVLAKTNGNSLQLFIILQLGLSLHNIYLWQFVRGRKAGLWSATVLKIWSFAGYFSAAWLMLGLMIAIASFHLGR